MITRARLCVRDFATGKNFCFNQCHNKEFWDFFFVFAWPYINTRGVGRILEASSRVYKTVSNSPNTENVFYCLNVASV